MHKLHCLLLSLLLALCTVTPALADETIIIRMAKDQTNGEVIHRAPAQIPLTCAFSEENSAITVVYFDDLGSASINIDNNSTGEECQYIVNAVTGVQVIPFSGTPGFWTILFRLSNGTSYFGEFEIS